ncbi:hypothetical protein OIU84_023551 [Salix udensis]|uniref:Peptidase A1 domain-containing protein n=1 Tax=Salix udensis TaxID=889485 RepID=A0AAD6PFW8_9ROSI|nr:hypothetical protein OIU84_023551 [Salix udensis]
MKAYLFFSLAFLLLSLVQGIKTEGRGTTVKVFHVYSPQSPFRPSKPVSWEDSVLQMLADDQARLQFLSSLAGRRSWVPIASGRQIVQSPTYIVKANVGTPAQTFLMALDTSNDAAWIPCNGCAGCSSTVFNSAASTTFKTLGCGAPQCKQVPNSICGGGTCTWNTTYGGSSILSNLTQDTIALSTEIVPSYTFGCIQKTTGSSVPPQGLLGLGRGGQPLRIKTTPLLKNPRRSSLYYVNLIGIRVGRRNVDIPATALAFNPATGAGTIFDSGTVFTRLVAPAYNAVRDEFRRRVGNAPVSSLGGFDTCYTGPIVAPTITFMFSGMNLTLPPDNLLIRSTAGSTSCLAMAAAPDNVNSVLNVIANMQQQNHRILFDVPNSRIGVAREPCS